ncbi:GyrI-like domain-containing protein [Micromonospora sp. KC721]|uniref:GyrI-like domain-containing protein n=1 Tax=Micromonospora sp. KC721 TaxID=2530380 RepID=UPI001046AF66|nr:GyrI-like domain-containing protein [Micromonospora sp. KC721]TDB81989.1 AraC family transcriptional regulator [Micromonospora sp. KC721]
MISALGLTVEGSEHVDTRIVDHPEFRLVGRATRARLVHQGINPHIQRHITALPMEEHLRLKALGNTEPSGLLAVSDDLDPDYAEGSELTYLHGVAVSPGTPVPGGLDIIEVPAGRWVVIRTRGPHPQTLQKAWATAAAAWFPSNPWRLRPGPEIVAVHEPTNDFSTATCELWLPVEPA